MAGTDEHSNKTPFGPASINLTTEQNPQWIFPDDMRACCTAFEALGFSRIGSFSIPESPGILLAAFTHPSEPLMALVTEHPQVGVWSEVDAQYTNGDGLTVTNCPLTGHLDHMPGQVKVNHPGKNEKDLLSAALRKLKRSRALTIMPGDFKPVFEEAYRREMAWRMGKGVTKREIRRVADATDSTFNENTIRVAAKVMNCDVSLPCAGRGKCPYDKDGAFEYGAESMPAAAEGDPRRCPRNGRLCMDFTSAVEINESEVPDPLSIEGIASVYRANPAAPIDITKESGSMKAAIRKAQASLDKFLRHVRADIHGERDFMVRIRLTDKRVRDYILVTNLVAGNQGFTGCAKCTPAVLTSVTEGQTVAFERSQITDWAYHAGKYWQGHFTRAVLLDRMQKATAKIEKATAAWSKKSEKKLKAYRNAFRDQ